MLVLSRRPGEAIVMRLPNGQRIKVIVCERRVGGAVALAIEAPRAVEIWREELAAKAAGVSGPAETEGVR